MQTAERAAERAISAVANAMVARYLAETDEQYVRAELRLDEASQAASTEQYLMGEQAANRRIEAMEAER